MRLPSRPNLEHLKTQAKDLLTLCRQGDAGALGRIRESLPVARGKSDAEIVGLGLRLRDMQSCLAREYGFSSWTDLKSFVEASTALRAQGPHDTGAAVVAWLRLVYAADIAGGVNRERPSAAARMLEENPQLAGGDPYVAC